MKKLLLTLFIICFLSCDTTELNKCNINYIPGQNLINYNGTWIQNMDINGNVLNNISIRPYLYNNSLILSSNNEIFSISLNNIKYRLRYINKNAYEIIFIEDNWLENNYNQIITINLIEKL